MTMRSTFARAAMLLAGPAILLGACKSAGSQVEEKIAPEVKKALNTEVTVTCPKEAKAKKGAKFTCEAKTPEGQILPVDITFVEDKKFSFKQGAAFEETTKLNGIISDQVKADSAVTPEMVSCGDLKFVIIKPGDNLVCKVTVAGATKTLKIPVLDVDGKLDFDHVVVE